MARRELLGCLEETFLGPTNGWDSAFLMISSIRVNQLRVTSPLALSGLGSGFVSFSGFFYLVMHTTWILISTQSNQKICRKADRGAGLLHAPYASCCLSFLIPNSLLEGTYQMHTILFFLKKKNGYTLLGNDAKMLRYKKWLLNSFLSYINYQSTYDFLFQECTQPEAGNLFQE